MKKEISKIKMIETTWSYDNNSPIKNQILYKSFKKFNPFIDVEDIHFNRNEYSNIEPLYNKIYGYQYDFILYEIILSYEKLRKIDADYFIFCNVNDVTCISSINNLIDMFDLENKVIFSAEKNRWPSPTVTQHWAGYTGYSDENMTNKIFLNGGGILSKKNNFLKLLEIAIDFVLNKRYVFEEIRKKDDKFGGAGGAQGVYTWIYNMIDNSPIQLDVESRFMVNTYCRTLDEYYMDNNKIYSKASGISPCFVHDNGWDYGSPRYHDNFNLKQLYV